MLQILIRHQIMKESLKFLINSGVAITGAKWGVALGVACFAPELEDFLRYGCRSRVAGGGASVRVDVIEE